MMLSGNRKICLVRMNYCDIRTEFGFGIEKCSGQLQPSPQFEQLRIEFQSLYFNFFTETVPLSKSCHFPKQGLVFYGLWAIFFRLFFEKYPFRCCFVDFLCWCYVNGGKSCTCFCRIFDLPGFQCYNCC